MQLHKRKTSEDNKRRTVVSLGVCGGGWMRSVLQPAIGEKARDTI